jgi:1-acyl-sn-glycerol-3-phosphate acyltransferase
MPYQALLKKIKPSIKVAYIFERLNFYIIKSYFARDLVQVKKEWAQELLKIINAKVTVLGNPRQKGPLLLLGNHVSYADVPIIMSVAPQVSFLSKKEISWWPIVGAATRRAHTIFVQRNSHESRAKSKKTIEKSLTNDKALIAAFPAGTTSVQENIEWRYGLFETAYVRKIKIQPFRIRYVPLRKVAFVGDDEFLPHLHNLLKIKKIRAVIEFHEPVDVDDPIECSGKWHSWAQEFVKKKK